MSLTPRQDLPRSRPQSRTRFGDFSEEQDYNPDSPPNHVARSRSPSTASRGGILRTPRASQQNTARTTQRTTASPRRTTRANTPGRSQTPRRTPREPDHPPPEDDDPYVHGFRFSNSPPEVLQWWRSRATPSDQELRNPRLFEKPEREECLCELCAKQTAFHCSLCDLITCSLCRVDYHCDCSTRWLNLGSSLMRNTFQDVREFVYDDSGTPFDHYELLEEHKEIISASRSSRTMSVRGGLPPEAAKWTGSSVRTLVSTMPVMASMAIQMIPFHLPRSTSSRVRCHTWMPVFVAI